MVRTRNDSLERIDIIREADFQVELLRGPDARYNGGLAFSFAQRNRGELSGLGFGGVFLLELGFDVIAIKTDRFDWYESLDAAPLAAISTAAALRPHRFRVGYGSSMGAHGVIRFAKALQLDRLLALSPIFDIGFDWDRRWRNDLKAPSANRPTLTQPRDIHAGCDHFIVYDPHDLDSRHVDYYRHVVPAGRLHTLAIPYAGHPAGFFLQEIDLLSPVAQSVLLQGNWPDLPPNWRRQSRRRSPSYLFWCAHECLARGHARWALSLIEAMLPLRPEDGEAHILHCRILLSLGDRGGARTALEKALATNHAHRPHYLRFGEQTFGDIVAPPTPGSRTDIAPDKGKDHAVKLAMIPWPGMPIFYITCCT